MATIMLRHRAAQAQHTQKRALVDQLRSGSRFLEPHCASCGVARSQASMVTASLGTNVVENSPFLRGRRWLTVSATSFKKKDEDLSSVPPCKPEASDSKPGVSSHPSHDEQDVKLALRSLLREVAQPVAVVTSFMPPGHSHANSPHMPRIPLHSHSHEHSNPHHRFHGATLSSFSSIAMDPHPLVAFALRVPSRMAATLEQFLPEALAVSSSQPPNHSTQPLKPSDPSNTHLVLNILSDTQHPLAHAFSRPDLHPHPFSTAPYTLNADGLPILNGSLGALACKVVGRVKLSELGWAEGEREKRAGEPGRHYGGVVSELFVARVIRVEDVGVLQKEGSEGLKPLLYWRRGYTGCRESS